MRIRTVDAFTDRPYRGNPAAVVLFEDGFPEPPEGDVRLQQLANELNLAETAYAHPLSDDPEADWALRWFTPTNEVRLCGHATLATAHVLHTDKLAHGTVRFRTLSGVLTASIDPDGRITLDFPTAELTPLPSPEGVAAAVGTGVLQTYDTGKLGDLLVELDSEQRVHDLVPDQAAVRQLDCRGLLVTARAEQHRRSEYDYVSRFFAPGAGIPEDPVTGSAHTALAPLWSGRLDRETLTGLQASARQGLVKTTLRGARTLLTGDAVTVLDAELLPDL